MSITAPITSKTMMPDGVTITETAVILAITTSAITMEDTATTGSVTAAENQPMDGEEEYDKRIAQLGVRYATIAE